MAMDRIQSSPLLRQGALDTFRKTREADLKDADKNSGSSSAGTPATVARNAGDQAVISPAGKHLVDLRQAVDTGRAALAALPEVREDRVADVRDRLGSGLYQSTAVREAVASRLTAVMVAMDSGTP